MLSVTLTRLTYMLMCIDEINCHVAHLYQEIAENSCKRVESSASEVEGGKGKC
jgi:hypothetical protein